MTTQMTGSRPASQQEVEQWVADSWRAQGLTVQGPATDFFSIGGTSLSAARFVAVAEEFFGEGAVPPEDFFEDSSVAAVAALILRNMSSDS